MLIFGSTGDDSRNNTLLMSNEVSFTVSHSIVGLKSSTCVTSHKHRNGMWQFEKASIDGFAYELDVIDKHSPLRISCRTLRRWAWPATAVPPRWRRGRPPYWFDSPTPSVFWLVRGQTHACYNIDKNTRYVICGYFLT